MSSRFKELYYQYTIEVYQSICVFLFVITIVLWAIIEFKSGMMEGYKSTITLLKTRSDEQIREIVILQEHYKYQQQEIVQLKTRVAVADNNIRRDIEDLKTKVNPPIKQLKR